MKTETIEISEIRDFAVNQAVKDTRVVDNILVGQHVRQGDIYVERVASLSGSGTVTEDRKLAPGTTQGARHLVVGDVVIYANAGTKIVDKKLYGPEIDAKSAVRIAHPEHADIELPAGIYQCYYQQDPATQQRVKD